MHQIHDILSQHLNRAAETIGHLDFDLPDVVVLFATSIKISFHREKCEWERVLAPSKLWW